MTADLNFLIFFKSEGDFDQLTPCFDLFNGIVRFFRSGNNEHIIPHTVYYTLTDPYIFLFVVCSYTMEVNIYINASLCHYSG